MGLYELACLFFAAIGLGAVAWKMKDALLFFRDNSLQIGVEEREEPLRFGPAIVVLGFATAFLSITVLIILQVVGK